MSKKRITNFNFKEAMKSGQDAHISFVGEGANQQECLIMKAKKQVTVNLDMREFLSKFYDMWNSDAEELAYMLGFDVDTYSDEYEAYLEDKAGDITFMKSAEVPDKLPETMVNKIKDLQKTFEDFNKTGSSESINNDKGDKMPKGTQNADELDLAKSLEAKEKETADLLKQLEDSKKAKEASDKAQADLLKSVNKLTEEMEARKEADFKKAKADMTDIIKSFTFVKEENKEALTDVLMSAEAEAKNVYLDALINAQDVLKTALEQEEGEDFVEDNETDLEKSKEVEAKVDEYLKKLNGK